MPSSIMESRSASALTNGSRWRRGRAVDRRFVPADPNDTTMTIILRIKGSDLAALRDRKLTREDARKRVEVKQY